MNESIPWLRMLVSASAQENAAASVRMIDAVLAGTAPVSMSVRNGKDINKETRRAFLRIAYGNE